MTLQRGATEINGNFKTQARLVAANVKVNSLVWVLGVAYSVDVADGGSGILLDNGLFANPAEGSQTATNTSDIAKLQADNPNNQTGTTYTLVIGDESKTVWMNNAAANILTVPLDATEAFPIDTIILVMMEGAGVTSVTAVAGVTVNGINGGTGDLTQFNGVTLVKRGINIWVATPLTVT